MSIKQLLSDLDDVFVDLLETHEDDIESRFNEISDEIAEDFSAETRNEIVSIRATMISVGSAKEISKISESHPKAVEIFTAEDAGYDHCIAFPDGTFLLTSHCWDDVSWTYHDRDGEEIET